MAGKGSWLGLIGASLVVASTVVWGQVAERPPPPVLLDPEAGSLHFVEKGVMYQAPDCTFTFIADTPGTVESDCECEEAWEVMAFQPDGLALTLYERMCGEVRVRKRGVVE